jgi:hypothetical protein
MRHPSGVQARVLADGGGPARRRRIARVLLGIDVELAATGLASRRAVSSGSPSPDCARSPRRAPPGDAAGGARARPARRGHAARLGDPIRDCAHRARAFPRPAPAAAARGVLRAAARRPQSAPHEVRVSEARSRPRSCIRAKCSGLRCGSALRRWCWCTTTRAAIRVRRARISCSPSGYDRPAK